MVDGKIHVFFLQMSDNCRVVKEAFFVDFSKWNLYLDRELTFYGTPNIQLLSARIVRTKSLAEMLA